jgi:hemerythrin
MRSGQAAASMKPLLSDLINYTLTHFRTEERYMQQTGYPLYAEHRNEHQQLTEQVVELNRRFDAGQTTITAETMDFLKDWLQNHILGTDKRYGRFFVEHGIGATSPGLTV